MLDNILKVSLEIWKDSRDNKKSYGSAFFDHPEQQFNFVVWVLFLSDLFSKYEFHYVEETHMMLLYL